MSNKVKEIGLTFLNLKEEELGKTIDKDVDIIKIIKPSKGTIERLRKKDFFYKPVKVTYLLKISNKEDYLKSLSHNRRKRMKKSIRNCKDIKIIKEKKITKKRFLEWYKIYKNNISDKDIGIIRIGKDWVDQKQKKAYAIYAVKGDKIIGGILLKKVKDLGRVSICYSASIKKYLSLGINDYLNLNVLLLAKELGYKFISRGMDTNLYGCHLSPGLYLFKKSLGYKVGPRKEKGDELIKIVKFDKFGDIILFFSYSNGRLEGNLFIKNKDDEKLIGEYNAEFIKKLNVFLIKDNKLIRMR